MKANAVPLLLLFEKKMRLEVPLFQRQYVWNREHQWEPLWEDISRKFTEYLEGRKDAPVHFLGAMVLDQKLTAAAHVEKRQVIDGQQRLTTFQIFLAAFRDFCREQQCEDLARELEKFTFNTGMMADKDVDKFKVWPTQLDREQFRDVVGLGSRAAIEAKHPLVKKKYTRKYLPRQRMVEAYVYFSDELRQFFLGTESDPPLQATEPLAARAEEAFQALKAALQVVAIDLEQGDDAQVIFETLNARGEPLLPADLLRNYIFLRAARLGEPHDELYERHWRGFDDAFWREEIRQGRLTRPRSDLFMQHFLSSRQCVDIPIKHLFVEYRFWVEREKPFASVSAELAELARQREDFRRLLAPKKDDPLFGLAAFLISFDVSTAYPLLLYLLDEKVGDEGWRALSTILESYLVRRAVLGWTTKAYNRIFLNLIKSLRRTGPTLENLAAALSALTGESTAWPTDEQFREAWMTSHAYHLLNNAKVVHVLRRLSDDHLTSKHEPITVDGSLTVEHIMPQSWVEHWPLATGDKGLVGQALADATPNDPLALATRRRNAAVQTFGNLTILTQALNSSVSNSPWREKRPGLMGSSLLPINQALHGYDSWDEAAIEDRSRKLFERALKIWPGPVAPKSG